jgi:hypothetical protein
MISSLIKIKIMYIYIRHHFVFLCFANEVSVTKTSLYVQYTKKRNSKLHKYKEKKTREKFFFVDHLICLQTRSL